MSISLALLSSVFVIGGTQDAGIPPANVQPVRLAISPVMDGKIESEEWETLSQQEGSEFFFQWEPERLFWAGKLKTGSDLVVSLDSKADGWLIGSDNLEFRFSMSATQPSVSVRRLDCSDPNGPKWMSSNVPNESIKVMATQVGDYWDIECAYTPSGNEGPAQGNKYGVRMDAVSQGSDLGEAFKPRALSFVNLQFDLGQDLPSGFSWKPDFLVRTVPVDDSFKVKYAFKRSEPVEFTQVDYRAEGYAKMLMASGSKPFPQWDKKGRVGESYATIISSNANVGYRILRLTLADKEGKLTTLRSSFKIADLIDFDINFPKSFPLDPDARIVRGSVDLRSNGLKRINGVFTLTVPETWTATRGKSTAFVIYHSRGVSKVPLEMIIPKDCVGVYPITFNATVGDKVISKTIFVPVGQN